MALSASRAVIFNLNNSKYMVKNNVSAFILAFPQSQIVKKHSYATEVQVDETEIYSVGLPKKKVSKAMQIYLQRAKEHDEFMKKAKIEYQIGKRHLANMMGEDPEHFTQADVDKAIEYLFPSSVHQPLAKPVFKPPEELFPPRKAAEFDESGRPFNSMFYTARPNFYQTIHSIVTEINKLNKIEDSLNLTGSGPDNSIKLNLEESVCLTKTEFEKKILESLSDERYEYFLNTMQRLIDHPLSYEAESFIMNYRVPRKNLTQATEVLPIEYDKDGRPFVIAKDCARKSARANVTVLGNGSGKITINGEDITYFKSWHHREQVNFHNFFNHLL